MSPAAPFILPFVLYVLTLAPTVYNLDSAELTTAVATGGIMRATGYPLFLVIGKLWSWLPVGDVGYRMNLMSAVGGAATILLADRILRRLQVGPWARWGALGLLASAPYFWALSLIAEVYTLHTAMMAAIIWSLLRWSDRPTPRRLALPIMLLVLSLGNHMATVLLFPGAAWFILTRHPRGLLQWKTVLVGAAAALLGASVFLYLPLRYGTNPVFNYAGVYDASGAFQPVDLQTLDGFLWLVTGRAFAGQMFGYSLNQLGPEIASFVSQLWLAFFAIGVGPGLAGLFLLFRRNWRVGGMLLLMFLTNAGFYITYRVVDKNTMFLPTYLIWSIWLGLGYHYLVGWLWTHRPGAGPEPTRFSRPLIWLTRGIMIGAVFLAVGHNWSLVDLSSDSSTREQSELILEMVEPGAIVFGWWDTVPALQYLQHVEGQRPDVTAINRFLISGEDMNRLILRELDRRPIYINNPSIELIRLARVIPSGPLYRLEPRQVPSSTSK